MAPNESHDAAAAPGFSAAPAPVPALALPAATPAAPPAPPAFAYRRPFRRYQQLALDAFDESRKDDRERCYVVMPPGSGKTVVGLEIARRLGRQTVVFGPNTAIQAQWVSQWNDFTPPKPAGTSPDLTAGLTVLTYQSLCTLDHGDDIDELAGIDGASASDEDEAADQDADEDSAPTSGHARDNGAAAERRRRRKLIVNGGDRAALLGLLHPNGRALIERMKLVPEITIVLDECHHLLEMWGHLIEAVVDELDGKAFVVGLTATPPGEMGTREAELYDRLFGRADFEVVTPAVVKEGELAPYQELAFLTEPLPAELEYMDAQSKRFDDLTAALFNPDFASRPFLDWLHQRVVERGTRSGVQIGWDRFELDEPELALATLRLFLARGLKTPDGAHIGERHRQPLTAGDWVAMMADYANGFLGRSPDPRDSAAREQIRRALPSVGYLLTASGIRSYVSPVDRLLALSASKGVAAQTILDLEQKQLGADLRALVLCDFERAGIELLAELKSVLDPQAGSASLILQLLVADAATRALNPILMSGRTVACGGAEAVSLVDWCGREVPQIAAALAALPHPAGDDDIVVIAPEHSWWQPRNYVPLITRYFEEGRTRCLVGTRGLLGEGWDAHSVNVLIDLTAAATATSVHQMRGRSLRLDPRLPHKVADNWDVVCVAPGNMKGAADYARFVRKHRAYYALTATGEIECGVSHVDPVLSPFGPPPETEMAALNERTLARIAGRDEAFAQWGIGQAYRNTEIETVRIHFQRSLGLPGKAVPGAGLAGSPIGALLPLSVAGGLAGTTWVAASFSSVEFGVFGGGAVLALGLAWAAIGTVSRLGRVRPTDTLDGIASAVVAGLAAAGGIARTLTPESLRIVVQLDGYYRCYLEGASRSDSRLFAESLDRVLAPLEDPRYIIPRLVVEQPHGLRQSLARVVRTVVGKQGGRRVYHAVPDYLAARQDRVKLFEKAWHKYVFGGEALFYRDPVAAGILAVAIGENPFETTSQMRTLWS